MLKLLYAPTSPFVRKVMVCAHLCGLRDQIELLDSAANPLRRDPRIAAHNPMAKVPTLILPDGQDLYDSRVICEYLASTQSPATLFPNGPQRWRALTLQALGDGLLDAALLARYETTARPPALQSPEWRQAQLGKVQACVAAIDAQAATLAVQTPSIGEVTIGCALGYVDFRFPELDWRAAHPEAAAWFARFAALPAMQATIPHEA